MDRGYPSEDWLGQLRLQGVTFCSRIGHPGAQVKRFMCSDRDDGRADLHGPAVLGASPRSGRTTQSLDTGVGDQSTNWMWPSPRVGFALDAKRCEDLWP